MFLQICYKHGTNPWVRSPKLILEGDINSVEINWPQTNEKFEFILSLLLVNGKAYMDV